MFPILINNIQEVRSLDLPLHRKQALQPLVNYIQDKVNQGLVANLNFICTHNSRRSQLSQIWAKTAADFFNIPIQSFSGGVEVTAFNERAVASLERFGFKIEKQEGENPVYQVLHSPEGRPIQAFSKLFDDPSNDAKPFAAIMTCSHAEENCPFIPGAEARIPVMYEDPKAFDNTPQEMEKYDERSRQIASELFYVCSLIQS